MMKELDIYIHGPP